MWLVFWKTVYLQLFEKFETLLTIVVRMLRMFLYLLLLVPYLVCGFTLSRENTFRRGSLQRIPALKAVSNNQLSSLTHDRMIIPDVHLVKALLPENKKAMPNWNSWVDDHVKKGKKLFVLPWVAEKIGVSLPASCEVLKCTTRSPYALEYVYNSIADGFNIAEPHRTVLKVCCNPHCVCTGDVYLLTGWYY